MFSLTVTEDEIQATLTAINEFTYPSQVKLNVLSWYVYFSTTETDLRKVRLCIAELRKRGYLIIAKRGYSIAGDDPEQAIHFINGLYSRANKLTKEADIMFHGLKVKYGDSISEKVKVNPDQPALGVFETPISNPAYRMIDEPPYRKSIDARGNEIVLQFEADA